jgi:hypothetical protein
MIATLCSKMMFEDVLFSQLTPDRLPAAVSNAVCIGALNFRYFISGIHVPEFVSLGEDPRCHAGFD